MALFVLCNKCVILVLFLTFSNPFFVDYYEEMEDNVYEYDYEKIIYNMGINEKEFFIVMVKIHNKANYHR